MEERNLSNDEIQRTSRRRMVQGGLGVIALAATAGRARAQEKLAQEIAQYQSMPKDGAKCSACVNWVEPAACKIVEGKIDPNGWCVAYAPKA